MRSAFPQEFFASMKRTLGALFVLFYVVASVATAGWRTANVADRMEHAAGIAHGEMKTPCAPSVDQLPNFRHAKAKSYVGEIPVPAVSVTPVPVVRKFEDSPVIEHSSPFCHESRSVRAPPALI